MGRIAPCSANMTVWSYSTSSGSVIKAAAYSEILSAIQREQSRRELTQTSATLNGASSLVTPNNQNAVRSGLETITTHSDWNTAATGQIIPSSEVTLLKNQLNVNETECICDSYYSDCHSNCHSNCHSDCHSNCHSDCNWSGDCHSNCNCDCHSNCFTAPCWCYF